MVKPRQAQKPDPNSQSSSPSPEGYAQIPLGHTPGAGAPDPEVELNRAFAAWLANAAARECMQYLRDAYINRILGPDATDAELRYREGARHVLAVIEMRASKGEKGK